jgi:hypothetical protein
MVLKILPYWRASSYVTIPPKMQLKNKIDDKEDKTKILSMHIIYIKNSGSSMNQRG